MASKEVNPALRAAATGLGYVTAEVDNREDIAPAPILQQQFVIRRARLRPDVARVVAALAFDRGAA